MPFVSTPIADPKPVPMDADVGFDGVFWGVHLGLFYIVLQFVSSIDSPEFTWQSLAWQLIALVGGAVGCWKVAEWAERRPAVIRFNASASLLKRILVTLACLLLGDGLFFAFHQEAW